MTNNNVATIKYNGEIIEVSFEKLCKMSERKHKSFAYQCGTKLKGYEAFVGWEEEDFEQLLKEKMYEEVFINKQAPTNGEFFAFYNKLAHNLYVDLQRQTRTQKNDARVISFDCKKETCFGEETYEGVLSCDEDTVENIVFNKQNNLITFLNNSLSIEERTLLRLDLESKYYKLTKKDTLLKSSILYSIQVLRENAGECANIKTKAEYCAYCNISRPALMKRRKKLEQKMEQLHSIILSGNMEVFC